MKNKGCFACGLLLLAIFACSLALVEPASANGAPGAMFGHVAPPAAFHAAPAAPAFRPVAPPVMFRAPAASGAMFHQATPPAAFHAAPAAPAFRPAAPPVMFRAPAAPSAMGHAAPPAFHHAAPATPMFHRAAPPTFSHGAPAAPGMSNTPFGRQGGGWPLAGGHHILQSGPPAGAGTVHYPVQRHPRMGGLGLTSGAAQIGNGRHPGTSLVSPPVQIDRIPRGIPNPPRLGDHRYQSPGWIDPHRHIVNNLITVNNRVVNYTTIVNNYNNITIRNDFDRFGRGWYDVWAVNQQRYLLSQERWPWRPYSGWGIAASIGFFSGWEYGGVQLAFGTGYFALSGYCPTPYMYYVESGRWYEPGAGYIGQLPYNYAAPLTVVVTEVVPVYDDEGDEVVDYEPHTFYYNAFFDSNAGAYGYYDYRGQFHWLRW